MTRSGWFVTGGTMCLLLGIADVAALTVWAGPKAYSAVTPTQLATTETMPAATSSPETPAIRPAPPAPVDEPAVSARPVAASSPTSVFFEKREASSPKGPEIIARLTERLRENPNLIVEIEGHADERITETKNRLLAIRRAHVLAEGLLDAGVRRRQVVVRTSGDDPTLIPRSDRTSLAGNRRVDMHIREISP